MGFNYSGCTCNVACSNVPLPPNEVGGESCMGARMRAPVWLTLRREHVGVRLVVVWATIVLRDVPMGGYGWVTK